MQTLDARSELGGLQNARDLFQHDLLGVGHGDEILGAAADRFRRVLDRRALMMRTATSGRLSLIRCSASRARRSGCESSRITRQKVCPSRSADRIAVSSSRVSVVGRYCARRRISASFSSRTARRRIVLRTLGQWPGTSFSSEALLFPPSVLIDSSPPESSCVSLLRQAPVAWTSYQYRRRVSRTT